MSDPTNQLQERQLGRIRQWIASFSSLVLLSVTTGPILASDIQSPLPTALRSPIEQPISLFENNGAGDSAFALPKTGHLNPPSPLALMEAKVDLTSGPTVAQRNPSPAEPIRLLPPIEGTVSASPETSAASTADYLLGPGDQVTIFDPSIGKDDQPYVTQAPILPDGTISIYPIGIIHAAGMTLKELNEAVNKAAEKYVINPQIVLTLASTRPISVYVLGDVLSPGLYGAHPSAAGNSPLSVAVSTSPTVGDAIAPLTPPEPPRLTVLTALQLAGGLKETADVRHVRLTRGPGHRPIEINLWRLLVEGDSNQDVLIQAGDVIFVPRGGANYDADALGTAVTQRRPVRIWGGVKTPGLYALGPSDDLFSIVAKAGGFTPTAVTRWVILSRLNRDGTVFTQKIALRDSIRRRDSVGRTPVMPGDIVMVANSPIKEFGPKIAGRAFFAGLAIFLVFFNAYVQGKFDQNTNQNSTTGLGIL